MRMYRWLLGAALGGATGLIAACTGSTGFESPPDGCPDEELYEAEACDEVYCGAPEVVLGVGGSSHEPVDDGATVPVWWGSQGGFHINISTETQNLCPVVFLRASMQVREPGEADWTEIFQQERHVQAVRPEPETSSRQQYWGIQGFVPCEHWPEFYSPSDPDNPVSCGIETGIAGAIDELEVRIVLEAEDHNGRIGTAETELLPECCNT